MTQEQNQDQVKNLEDRLVDVGMLSHVSHDVEKSKSPTERANLYPQLATILAKKDKGKERELIEGTNYNNLEDMYLSQLRYGPETAISFSGQRQASELSELEPIYKENKDAIVAQVIASMKDTLGKKAKNKAEAAMIISQYLEGLLGDVPELDQTTADKYARNNIESVIGIRGLYDVRGSIEKYRNMHEQNSLVNRILGSEYLQDIKDKESNVTGYKLNEGKIAKDMENIKYGAVVYANTKLIEKSKEIEKAKKQESAS